MEVLTYSTHNVACAADFPIHRGRKGRGANSGVRRDLAAAQLLRLLAGFDGGAGVAFGRGQGGGGSAIEKERQKRHTQNDLHADHRLRTQKPWEALALVHARCVPWVQVHSEATRAGVHVHMHVLLPLCGHLFCAASLQD